MVGFRQHLCWRNSTIFYLRDLPNQPKERNGSEAKTRRALEVGRRRVLACYWIEGRLPRSSNWWGYTIYEATTYLDPTEEIRTRFR